MADFKLALDRVLAFEGGYSFDPDDPGGETIFGISRRAHPNWPGWTHIDRLKNVQGKRPLRLSRGDVSLLQDFAVLTYRVYWDAIHGDDIPSQGVATFLFDTAVNMGVAAAVVMLEQTLFGSSDGLWDEATTRKLQRPDIDEIIPHLVDARIARYERLIARNPKLAKFRKGWLRRVKEVST